MEQRRNKFAYDREYYRNVSARITEDRENYVYGNTARRLDYIQDPYADDFEDSLVRSAYEELVCEPLYNEPAEYYPERELPYRGRRRNAARKTRPEREVRRQQGQISEPRVKVKKVFNIDLVHLAMLLIAVAATVFACYRYLDAQSELNESRTAVSNAESRLSGLRDKNNIIEASLDTPYDAEYILTYAVSKLGMVYPDKNQVVSYAVSDSGYVKQYEDIPEEQKSILLETLLP